MRAEDFDSVPGHGAIATVDGRRVAVGNRRLMEREKIDLGPLAEQRQQLAENGRTAVIVAVDGRAVGLIAMADAPRDTSAAAVAALRALDMRSDPLDVPVALQIGRGTLRKMRQNLGWAVGYNVIALPIAAGVFEPAFGLVLRPEIAALSMSGSSIIVAVNAVMLKRIKLPTAPPSAQTQLSTAHDQAIAGTKSSSPDGESVGHP